MTISTTHCAIAAIAAVLASPALAQTATPTDQGTSADAASTAGDIGEIVVTAQRRAESLQRAAIAVSALSTTEIESKGVVNVTELTKLVPAIKIGAASAGTIQITVRGVGNFGGDTYAEPGVAVNLDGVYLARNAGPSGIFYDIDRVEILKGPQGTLYGRNSTGGVVNVITKKPKLDTVEGNVTVEAGNYGLLRGSAAVNLPLGSKVALRVSGQVVDRDGYLSDGYSDEKVRSVRGQLKIEPTPDLSIVLDADYSNLDGKGTNGVFLPYLDPKHPYQGPSTAASNAVIDNGLGGAGLLVLPDITDQGFLNIKNYGYGATVDYSLGGVHATVIASHREFKNQYLHFGAGFPITDDNSNDPSNTTTVEARLSSDSDGPLKWVLGGFYYKDELNTNIVPEQGVTFNQTHASVNTESKSGFGQATFSVTDSLRLTAGARYTSDDKQISGYYDTATTCPRIPAGPQAGQLVFAGTSDVVITRAGGYNQFAGAGVNVPVNGCRVQIGGPSGSRQATFNKFTWKLGVDADIGPASLLYASVGTGFKAGGFFAAGNDNDYQPETITAYTIGSKNRFLDNHLQINVEGYYWKYKDKQVSHLGPVQPFGYNLVVDNAASATIYGVEIEALFKPSAADLITINYQYNHTRYGTFRYDVVAQGPRPTSGCGFTAGATGLVGGFNSFTVDCSGRVLPFAPQSVLNAAYQHTFDLGGSGSITPAVSTHIESSFYTGDEFLPSQLQGASMVSDADITWRSKDERIFVTAYVQNIENEAVLQTSFIQPTLGLAVGQLRAPRTYGLRAGYKF